MRLGGRQGPGAEGGVGFSSEHDGKSGRAEEAGDRTASVILTKCLGCWAESGLFWGQEWALGGHLGGFCFDQRERG